jgi:DNA binding domain, excisionase family
MRHPETESIEVNGELVGEDALVVPRQAVTVLAFILSQAAEGQGVAVFPSNAELTTQQAAHMLNVSRPYLIKLLEAGEIEFRLVGKHRRITAKALMQYKRYDDLKRRAAADDLASLGQELDLR